MTEKNTKQDEILDQDETELKDQQTELDIAALVEELKDKLIRNAAETENMRKRFEKQIEEAKDYAVFTFAKDLINVTDNINRAISHKPDENNKEANNILQGVEMIFSEFNSILTKHNIKILETNIGDKFDYNNHQAITQIPTKDYPKGVIVDIMQIGYKLKDRLLRPSVVAISDDLEENNEKK
jgi:molecular chaperone GrpE